MTTPAVDGQGVASAVGGPDALPSPLDSVGDMRAAAKWTLAAAGAVGAALIGGAPLVAVGQVHGVLHAVLAGLGLALALAGVGTAIWFTSKVLVPRLITPAVFKNAGGPKRPRRGSQRCRCAFPNSFSRPVNASWPRSSSWSTPSPRSSSASPPHRWTACSPGRRGCARTRPAS